MAMKLTATSLCLLRHPGITSGLMKGALSVAASAYKALFTGQGPTQVTGQGSLCIYQAGFSSSISSVGAVCVALWQNVCIMV